MEGQIQAARMEGGARWANTRFAPARMRREAAQRSMQPRPQDRVGATGWSALWPSNDGKVAVEAFHPRIFQRRPRAVMAPAHFL
jgi:hypothetical protein